MRCEIRPLNVRNSSVKKEKPKHTCCSFFVPKLINKKYGEKPFQVANEHKQGTTFNNYSPRDSDRFHHENTREPSLEIYARKKGRKNQKTTEKTLFQFPQSALLGHHLIQNSRNTSVRKLLVNILLSVVNSYDYFQKITVSKSDF